MSMRVELNKNRRAKCRICDVRITDEYRVYSVGYRSVLYFHIGCLRDVAESLRINESRLHTYPNMDNNYGQRVLDL